MSDSIEDLLAQVRAKHLQANHPEEQHQEQVERSPASPQLPVSSVDPASNPSQMLRPKPAASPTPSSPTSIDHLLNQMQVPPQSLPHPSSPSGLPDPSLPQSSSSRSAPPDDLPDWMPDWMVDQPIADPAIVPSWVAEQATSPWESPATFSVEDRSPDPALAQLKSQYDAKRAEQARLEEERRQQALQAEQQRQERLQQQRRAVQVKQAEQWLKSLDPHGGEGMWFEQFAVNYPSRLEAAIDYLGVAEDHLRVAEDHATY